MSSWLQRLFSKASSAATSAPECARRLYQHMLATLVSPCRDTITNLICLCARAHLDWTADYRLYSRESVDAALLFGQVLAEIHEHLPPQQSLVTAIDDTLVRKSGPKIDGVGWKRDPLGPPFQTNLVRGQRFVQLSAAWPGAEGQARMIPGSIKGQTLMSVASASSGKGRRLRGGRSITAMPVRDDAVGKFARRDLGRCAQVQMRGRPWRRHKTTSRQVQTLGFDPIGPVRLIGQTEKAKGHILTPSIEPRSGGVDCTGSPLGGAGNNAACLRVVEAAGTTLTAHKMGRYRTGQS